MKKITLFIVISALLGSLSGQIKYLKFANQTEEAIFLQWQNDKTLKNDIIACLLIAEGNSSHLNKKDKWLDSLRKEVAIRIDQDLPPLKKGKKLYEFIQQKVLRKYSTDASANTLITAGEFTCVTASALYYELGTALGIPIIFHSTPFHVCPIIETGNKKVWIEMTDPEDGFDKFQDVEGLIEWLIDNKFVLPEELEQKGEDVVYNEFLSGHYQISVSAILAYHYYNHALKQNQLRKIEDTFWDLAKANFLEVQDEAIKLVYDASFLQMSLEQKLSSSYFNVAKIYFGSRIVDTSICTQALSVVKNGIENQLDRDRDFAQADSIVALIEPISHFSDICYKTYNEIVQFVSINKVYELKRVGKYEESFNLMTSVFDKDMQNATLQDTYVNIGIAYVENALSTGKDDVATFVVDTLLRKLPDFASLREIYIRLLVNSAMGSNSYLTNPKGALIKLMKAYCFDSTNTIVRHSLAATYHELAMAEIRKNNWPAAQRFVNDGLKIMPDHEFLKSDFVLIRKEKPKNK